MARDPALADRFKEAVTNAADGTSGPDALLKSFSLPILLKHPNLAELSPLERLVFLSPFLTFLQPTSANTSPAQRALGVDAATIIRQVLPQALDQLSSPPTNQADLPDLSPLPISKLFSILLSDMTIGDQPGEGESVFTDGDRRAIVLAAVRGRLGPEVGSQALAHALGEITFDPANGNRSPVAVLARLSPVPALCSPDLVRNVLSRFANLTQIEGEVGVGSIGGGAEMRVSQMLVELIELANKDQEGANGIDIGSWVRAVHDLQPSLRWADVTRAYDNPLRALPDGRGLGLFATLLNLSPGPAEPGQQYPLVCGPGGSSAVTGLWTPWANPQLQFGLIERLLYLPPDVFNLPTLGATHKVVSPEDAAGSSPTVKQLAAGVQTSPWNCLEFVSTLIRLNGNEWGPGNQEIANRVHDLLDRGCKSNPELILIALIQIEKPWSVLHAELAARLLSTFLNGHPAHQLVFLRLFQIDRLFLSAALRDFYTESEVNVTRIVDVIVELKVFEPMLQEYLNQSRAEARPFFLACDLAALASRREYLNLQVWLNNAIASVGAQFVRATLDFLGHKVRHDLQRQELDPAPEPTTLSLNAATVAIFITALRKNHELFTGNDVELFKEVRTQCLQLYPRLMNFSPSAGETEPGMRVVEFAPEIEQECDALYKRMYDQEVSIEDVVSALQKAKETNSQHDHDFLGCFLHGLFDEHRFFNTYPANELSLTACLFGDLIQFQLIGIVPLGIAVRYVLDALRNPPDSNWFKFGIQALSRFSSRLAEWPQLARSILAIPHVQQLHPEVANTAKTALLQREAGTDGFDDGQQGTAPADLVPYGTGLPTEPVEEERPAFTAIHVDRAGDDDPAGPDEQTSDKILFIVNNLAPSNFDSKVDEMMRRIQPVHFGWFAHYLVAQRVSIEPNNHQLYQKFLDALDMPVLVKRVLYETFVKLATLLNSEKTVKSTTERTLLKNLGSWLGGLTLAKNKPIKHQNIAFKELLIQGYDNNRLIVAIPFVCKVLEQCAKSRVFRPPNPWLMAIVRLLVELYQFAELKLNLKFEIEVLCKTLNVDLKAVEPTDLLRNRPKEPTPAELALQNLVHEAEQQQHQQLSRAGPFGGPPGVGRPMDGTVNSRGGPSLVLGSNQPGYSLSLQDTISAALQPLPTQITFNPQVPMFANNNSLRRLVCIAIDRAVREIIAPVVERSVTIAGISTRELTMKDFAMEGDEEKMGTAAHLMVQNLAGSLALVTCKEPLRISMVTHIRTLLLQNGFNEQSLPEQAILVVAADNLDLACGVVEKVAMEKAVQEVDDGLGPAYGARRAHRDRSREAFWDTAAMAASHYSGMLPDPLRLKLGVLSPQQLQVYEDFSRVRTLQIQAAEELRNGGGLYDSPGMAPAQVPLLAEGGAPPALLTGPQAMDKFAGMITELEKCLATESCSSLARLSPDNDIRLILQQIPTLAAASVSRDETALGSSQKIVQLLYRSETLLAREVYVFLLERLCSLSAKVAKEVTAWLVYAEDERKFNVQVTTALVQARLINLAELDVQLAKFVAREFRPSVVDFVAKFVAECLMDNIQVATRDQLTHSIEALVQAGQAGKATDASRQVLNDIRGGAGTNTIVPSRAPSPVKPSAEDVKRRERLTYCFGEWVRLYQQSYSVEKSFVDFVVQLQAQGILKGEEISSLFFRTCAEVSVESYIKSKAAGATPATGIYQPVDAFAKLIVFMIKYHADPTGANNDKAKVHYMTKVLSIVVLVLAKSHEELGPNFEQKPFYRFFSSLLSNLHAIEAHLGSAYYQILVALSHSVNTLQPLFFPGFTFSWVSLISHRLFMPKLLQSKSQEGWSSFHRQLVSLLRFLGPFLRKGELAETTRALYLGTQRIILVLLHDFPDFLTQAFFGLCDAIPTQCIQLNNLILSAFPLSTRLPDPLQPGFLIEQMPEVAKSPVVLSDYTAALSTAELRASLDQYLSSREPVGLVATLKEKLMMPAKAVGEIHDPFETGYNVSLMNSLVMYVGVVALNQAKAQTGGVKFQAEAAPAQLLEQLLHELGPEGRYGLLSAVVLQLRYPQAHTFWFASFLLHAFGASRDAIVKEQVARCLLERIVVVRPHSWGVIYTFNKLLTEPEYGLMEQEFIRNAPVEVQHMFKIAQSSTAQVPPPQAPVGQAPQAVQV